MKAIYRYFYIATSAFDIILAVFQFAHGFVWQGWFLIALAVFMTWSIISSHRNMKKLDEANERIIKAMKDYYDG